MTILINPYEISHEYSNYEQVKVTKAIGGTEVVSIYMCN